FPRPKCAKRSPECAASALQRLHKVEQLHRRKLSEPILDILLLPLEEDPSCDFVKLTTHEVNPAAHGAQTGIWLALEIHVPALVAALQLAHVLAIFCGRHGPYTTVDLAFLPAGLHSPRDELPSVWCSTLRHCAILPQVWRGRGDGRSDRLAGRAPLGARGGGARSPRDGAGAPWSWSGEWGA